VIAEAGRTERRSRALPARVMAYFSIGMALHSEGSYEDVFAQLTDGLSWSSECVQSWVPPSKSAIFQARSRLGFEPVRDLLVKVAHPLAGTETPGSWLAGRRLVAIDGTSLDLVKSRSGWPLGRSRRPGLQQARNVSRVWSCRHALPTTAKPTLNRVAAPPTPHGVSVQGRSIPAVRRIKKPDQTYTPHADLVRSGNERPTGGFPMSQRDTWRCCRHYNHYNSIAER
jgi:hypothetical protein